jgi:putative PEP-CTERM system histidine kinase
MNWESRDLLLAIGQQVASYLAEERATRTLLESSVLIEQSKRFAFVMHDIKNVAGQLSLMIANVPRFGERAEFRADLTKGMENSVRKLNDLLGRLRPGNIQTVSPQIANLASVLNAVVDEFQGGANAIRREIGDDDTRVCISPVNLHAIFTHLIANALEASPAGAMVVVSSHRVAGTAMVDITDKGGGMSQEFIRTELFAPYRSSKPTGHGVGAFQARDLARSAKGDIEVISAIGRGTTVRVKLPYAAVDMTRAGVR